MDGLWVLIGFIFASPHHHSTWIAERLGVACAAVDNWKVSRSKVLCILPSSMGEISGRFFGSLTKTGHFFLRRRAEYGGWPEANKRQKKGEKWILRDATFSARQWNRFLTATITILCTFPSIFAIASVRGRGSI
jgi:hypothetical protein